MAPGAAEAPRIIEAMKATYRAPPRRNADSYLRRFRPTRSRRAGLARGAAAIAAARVY